MLCNCSWELDVVLLSMWMTRAAGLTMTFPQLGSELQAQVGVLVVGGLPLEAEATDPEEVRLPHHEAGRGAEVDRQRRVVVVRAPDGALAHLDHVAGRQRDAPHLLDPSVGVEEHRPDRGDVRVGPHGRAERLDPTGLHEGVVVEEDHVVAAGIVDADVVSLAEVPVRADLDQDEVVPGVAPAQDGELLGVGPVVHDDDLPDQRRSAPRPVPSRHSTVVVAWL